MAKIIHQMFGHDPHHSLSTSKEFIAGLECEIESVATKKNIAGFQVTNDGSLRNEGVEFISQPLPKILLLDNFKKLHATIQYHNKDEAFSPRTSTHVHVNCRSLTDVQVKTLMLLYALYEEFFFAMVEDTRRGNIHCVPLTETVLINYYMYDLNYLIQRWHKYTALNLLPLTKLGTVEFRHMQGTDDTKLMTEWLETLNNLWQLAQKVELTAAALTNPATVEQWFTEIFKASPKIMALKPCLTEMTQNSLVDVKLSLV